MNEKIDLNTEVHEKADELAKLGADLDKANRNEWSGWRVNCKQCLKRKANEYAASFHEAGGGFEDTQPCEDQTEDKV